MGEDISITVVCDECDRVLDTNGLGYGRDGASIRVNPCEYCMNQARNSAYDDGKADGKREAKELTT